MGMGLIGKNPTGDRGESFDRNIWGWHPLAKCLTTLFPELTNGCRYWHTNDGDGLNSEESIALADAIDSALADGTIQAYISQRDIYLAKLPDEKCDLCGGAGTLRDGDGKSARCRKCNGRGSRKHFDRNYYLEQGDLREFSAFLRDCGGFEIF